MNKLANTYLDAVDSLLEIHFKHQMPDDWTAIISNLTSAVRAMNQPEVGFDLKEVASELEAMDARKGDSKPLKLKDLKRHVDEVLGWTFNVELNDLTGDQKWIIGDFEIRRRK